MKRAALTVLGTAIFACVVAATASTLDLDDYRWVHYLCKPAATLLMLLFVALAGNEPNPRYRRAAMAGLLLSACGDAFLMLPVHVLAQSFMFGLASFLLAHLCYLWAFTSDARWFGKPVALLGFIVVGAINLTILWPGIPSDLQVPVVIYVGFLIMMTSQAVSRFLSLKTAGSGFAAFGGILFLLSDTLIAYDKFHHHLIAAQASILVTYYGATWLIAKSACSEHLKLKT
ncbi:MAG TPA: lysoplasmalogenase [Burkholderiaceae bacterium]